MPRQILRATCDSGDTCRWPQESPCRWLLPQCPVEVSSHMTVEPYRRVLAIPGVRALLLVGLVARIPVAATGLTLTLRVVNSLKLGFFQAGLVGAAATVGVAVGAPVAGRL